MRREFSASHRHQACSGYIQSQLTSCDGISPLLFLFAPYTTTLPPDTHSRESCLEKGGAACRSSEDDDTRVLTVLSSSRLIRLHILPLLFPTRYDHLISRCLFSCALPRKRGPLVRTRLRRYLDSSLPFYTRYGHLTSRHPFSCKLHGGHLSEPQRR
jgi:hypothetical protein